MLCLALFSFMDYSMSDFPVLHYYPGFAQTRVHWVDDDIQPLLPPQLLPSIFPSIRVFSNELALCIRWLKYWSFSFSISPSNEYSGLISFRIDWFDLFAVQGTLKSLLRTSQFKNINSSCSAFVVAQLSNPYLTTGKIIALTIWTFVSKVMSLLFNTVSRFVIAFLPRSKRLLISRLQSLVISWLNVAVPFQCGSKRNWLRFIQHLFNPTLDWEPAGLCLFSP